MLYIVPVQAQKLKIVVKSRPLPTQATLVDHGKFYEVNFDKNGCWMFNDGHYPKPADMILMTEWGLYPVVLQDGKSQTVILSRKKDNTVVNYGGDNVEAARFFQAYALILPEKSERSGSDFSDMEIEDMRKAAEARKVEKITYAEAFKRLKNHYENAIGLAGKIVDPAQQAHCRKIAGLAYLKGQLDLTADQAWSEKRDVRQDEAYRRLIAQIDPNDIEGYDQLYGLPQVLVDYYLTTTPDPLNVMPYYLDYIGTVDKHISNQTIKDGILDNFATSAFNATGDAQATHFDLDAFWSAFKRVASKQAVDKLQFVVDSKKNTAVGAKCPDVTFSDVDGNKHRLSDYFGTYLFIDIWATWCGPCCAEIPYIEKHVAHYKDNDRIKFLSISIDSKTDAWKKKLAKDKPQWPQFLCDKQEYDVISKAWGITGIPRFIIVNPDGTIRNPEAFRPSDPDFYSKIDAILK